ncbi:MAG TPA: hypothetical protein VMV14_11300 [Acidimicrobiales bacterium]|nr:hypothetical protein [Acidimicrobiales bacterium]
MANAKSPKRAPMSDQHKEALARGREEGRAVRRYLEAIEHQRPRRGRRRTPDSVARRLAVVKEKVADADALSRLHLLQEQADLEAELGRVGVAEDVSALEKAFVNVAKSYGARKGIGYNAWRSAGVSAAVLSKAGITRAD